MQVPGAPPTSCQVLGSQLVQAEPGIGRGGTQDRRPGVGVQVADGHCNMGSRGSAMYEGECVSERASDGSPFLQAAEAAVTDGGASRDCVQSSAPTASGKELLQRVVGVEGLPVRRGWGCRPWPLLSFPHAGGEPSGAAQRHTAAQH